MGQEIKNPKIEHLDRVFAALSDPTRRDILKSLAGGPMIVGDLAKPFSMSLPAISKHLRVLQDSGLVAQDKIGRERRCLLNPEPLLEATQWLNDCRDFWSRQFASLDQYFADIEASSNKNNSTNLTEENEMSANQKIVLKHTFNATSEAVFTAWTTPALMVKWFDASSDDLSAVNVKDIKVDLRTGGSFEFKMGGSKLHAGEYREVVPGKKLVFTWNSPAVKNTLVTIELKPIGAKTELTLTHELLPEDMVSAHNKGWTRIFKHLDASLAK